MARGGRLGAAVGVTAENGEDAFVSDATSRDDDVEPNSDDERSSEGLQLLRDVELAEAELARGEGVPHEEARRRILAALRS